MTAECVYPVDRLIGGNCFRTMQSRSVKSVYDSNSSGVLFPVPFEQEGEIIRLTFANAGQVYYKYRKQ